MAWLLANPGPLILAGIVVTGVFVILITVLFARSETPQSRLLQLISALRPPAPPKPRASGRAHRR